jgi:hypothetical protein
VAGALGPDSVLSVNSVVKDFLCMRKDCALSVLSEEQQADLFDWLTTDTYDVVLRRIAQPPPDGFGIKTHINSLIASTNNARPPSAPMICIV